MISKTTLTKLKRAYSTLSFVPRALRVETNSKFYKLIVSILRGADKRTKPDKIEEEEYERGEVLAKLMLAPSETAAIFSKSLAKPEAYQKSSFLAPVDNKQRGKSTFSKKEDSQQNDLNNPLCKLQEDDAESMPNPVPQSKIKTETQVNKAPKSEMETLKQETILIEKKEINPPNSLQNAIPDIILDKNKINDFPDEKTSDQNNLCSSEKEKPDGNILNNIQNNIRPITVNNMFINQQSYIQSRLDGKDVEDYPSIKFFASYDKTKKPPSTETNSTFDELAKHCLDSPNNEIDERLLKEMKKLGIPQSPKSENSVIEGDIIQMDVLRKPRKPAEKTEIDVETRKFEHPPLNYSDEQRLEFELSDAEEKDLLEAIQSNKKDISELTPQLCDVRSPMITSANDRPLLNPFDERKIKIDDDEDNDCINAEIYFHTNGPGAVKKTMENTNEPLNTFHSNSQNDCQNTNKPLQLFSENKACTEEPLKNPSNPLILSSASVNNANFTDLTKADEPHVLSKRCKDKVHTTKMNTTPLTSPSGLDFQAEGELEYSTQLEKNTQKIVRDREQEKRCHLQNMFCGQVPKIPEPLMVFNPPDQKSAKLSVDADQKDFPRVNEDISLNNNVIYVKNLKSLRIRCNVLPTKNTDEKSTISLLVEIDAIKQPRDEMAARNQPDVTYREDSDYQQQHLNLSPAYQNKVDHITRDKVTLTLPAKEERTIDAQVNSFPKEKPEIPLSEMLKRVRLRNRAEYFNQFVETLEHEWDTVVETVTAKCGDKKPACPPRCPPPQKPRCPQPKTPPCAKPACPRPCVPACPKPCPPRCPRPCGPSRRAGGNPCCPGSGTKKEGGNPCCPGSGTKREGGNPCCPGSGSKKKGGNPCCPGSSSSPGRQCKFSMHLPTIMMNSFVSLIHQRVMIAESELARNHFFMVTKDAYQRLLCSGFFTEKYCPHLLTILNVCEFDCSLGNLENTNSMLARDYRPWVPIPCWPVPKKAKKSLPCQKGCQIPLPGKLRPPCNPYPCRGFPKRKNSFSIIDLYACWSKPNGRQ